MPDLKSELSKVLNEWNPSGEATMTQPQAKAYFTVTNNVTRATFNYVRDNPGKTRKEITVALNEHGFKPSSVTSLLGQMVKQGQARDSAGLLYVTTSEYAPLKSSKVVNAKAQTPPEQVPQRKKVIIVRKGKPAPEPVAKEWSPNDVIDTLTVHQAIALFKALRDLLVG